MTDVAQFFYEKTSAISKISEVFVKLFAPLLSPVFAI